MKYERRKMKATVYVLRLVLVLFSCIFCSSLLAKKIFLTGGAGFIGSHLAQKLLQRGDSVVIVDKKGRPLSRRIRTIIPREVAFKYPTIASVSSLIV